jgi:hypothetical protein
MNRRLQTALAAICGMAMVGAGLGCEDAEAKRRAEVQQQITDARTQFQRASLASTDPGDDHAQQTRSELNRIVSNLQGVTDGAPGQQAAKSLLMAEALRELSLIEYRRIHALESEHQVERQIARNRLLGLQRLAAAHQAREAITAQQYRAELQQLRRATDDQLRQLQQQIAQLSQPIAELTERNERDRERVDELREQAIEMIRKSEELGPADGFRTFEEAIKLHREADLIEFRAAQRELELMLEHQPRHDMAERSSRAAEDLKQQLQQAIHDLESFDQIYSSAASQLRSRIEEGRDELREYVERITASMRDELSSAYEEAARHMERAASQARQAAMQLRGEDANAARLVEARANESLGRLYWQQAAGVTDHLDMLAATVAATDVNRDTQPYQAKISQFADQRETLIAQAKDAMRQATDTLGMVGGTAAQQYRQNVEMLLSAMEGEQVDAWQRDVPRDAATDREARPAAPGAASTGAGFDSADALIAFLRGMDGMDSADVERMINAIHAESRLAVAYKNMMSSMMRSSANLMAAVEDQFGAAAVDQIEQAAAGMGGATAFDNISVIEQTDTRVTARYQAVPGMPDETMELVNVGGEWFIDGDSLIDQQMVQPGMEDASVMMLEQMSSAMGQQINELTQRVRAGEFASVEQFMQAMMQAIMEAAGGMQGMP